MGFELPEDSVAAVPGPHKYVKQWPDAFKQSPISPTLGCSWSAMHARAPFEGRCLHNSLTEGSNKMPALHIFAKASCTGIMTIQNFMTLGGFDGPSGGFQIKEGPC